MIKNDIRLLVLTWFIYSVTDYQGYVIMLIKAC